MFVKKGGLPLVSDDLHSGGHVLMIVYQSRKSGIVKDDRLVILEGKLGTQQE